MQTILDRILSLQGDMTDVAFCRRIGCSKSTLDAYRKGTRRLSSNFLWKVSGACNVSFFRLLFGEQGDDVARQDSEQMAVMLLGALLDSQREIAALTADSAKGKGRCPAK